MYRIRARRDRPDADGETSVKTTADPKPCPTCGGTGVLPDPYDVYIPTQCHWCLGTKVYPPEPPEDHR